MVPDDLDDVILGNFSAEHLAGTDIHKAIQINQCVFKENPDNARNGLQIERK